MRKRILCAVMALCLFLSNSAALEIKAAAALSAEQLNKVAVTAESVMADGTISVNSGFLVTVPNGVTAAQLKAHIAIEPDTAYKLESGGNAAFVLRPDKPLKEDSAYRVIIKDSGGKAVSNFNFVTQAKFKLLRTTPGRRGDGPTKDVATDTGIEFVFNRPNVDISKAFSISPEVKGRFLTYESRSVFVPTEPLKPATAYTVKLDKSVAAPDGSVLGEDITLAFVTAENVKPEPSKKPDLSIYIQNYSNEAFLSTDPVAVPMYVRGDKKGQEFRAEAFRLSEQEYAERLYKQYEWTYKDNEKNEDEKQEPMIADRKPAYAVTSPLSPNLQRTYIYDGRYESQGSYSGIVFPKTFEKGYYVIQVSGVDERTKQTVYAQNLIQVNDLAVYTTSVDGGAMLWLNDAATGNAAANRSVELLDIKTRTVKSKTASDSQGVANFSSVSGEYAMLHVPAEKSGSPDYWQLVNLQSKEEYNTKQKYMSYMRLDRRLYKPTDKIQVWGVVRARTGSLPSGTRFTVELHDTYHNKPLKSVTVTPAPDGSFSAEFSIAGYNPEYYQINLSEAGGIQAKLTDCDFYIQNYTKPEYKYETFSNKEFYLPGETPVVGVRASFFEGTPASGMAFRGPNSSQWLYTDANGEITVPLQKPSASSFDNSWAPQYLWYDFRSKEGGTYLEDGVYYFPSNLILQAEFNGGASKPSVSVKTNLLDTSRLKSADDIYTDYPSMFLGKAADTKLNIEIKKETNKPYKEHKEVYYDWITKKQQTTVWYDYKWETKTLASYSAATKNGVLNITNLPDEVFKSNEKHWSYCYMEITATDKNGYKTVETVYLDSYYIRQKSSSFNALQGYYFTRDYNSAGADPNAGGGYKYSSSWYSSWNAKLGETVRVRLDDRLNEKANGRMMYYFVKDKIIDCNVTASRNFSFTESSAYLPRVKILGAFFDGKHIYPVEEVDVHYDYEDEKLDVKITPSSDETKPGGSLGLTVEVRDKSGKPVQTVFNLAVVDEALLALSGNWGDSHPMYDFFGYYPIASYSFDASYHQYKGVRRTKSDDDMVDDEEDYIPADDFDTGGGDGGGPDLHTRENFKDTAKFISGKTDSGGKAYVTLTMPDNITSWQASVVAVDLNGARAGKNEVSLRVTQPAFVQVSAAENYLASEDVGIALRMRGKMAENTPVKYYVELKNQNGAVIRTYDRDGTVLKRETVNFGRLPVGSYKFTVTGRTAAGADKIELPFTVSAVNDLLMPISKRITLEGENTGLDIRPSRYPVVIGFVDERYNAYMQAASEILYGSSKNAADVISAYTAAEFMKKYSDNKNLDFSYLKTNIEDYIVEPGYGGTSGVALYTYDDPDVKLTAFTAMLMGDKLSADAKKKLINYLTGCVYYWGNGADNAAAYMGLAALGAPITDRIRDTLKNVELHESDKDSEDIDYSMPYQFDSEGWSYICAALAIAGDKEGAREVFNKHVAPEMNKTPSDGDVYKAKAAALVAASAVDSTYAPELAAYLADNYSPYYSANKELAWFLKCFKAGTSGTSQFQYRKNGVVYTEKLDKSGIKYISFSKEDLDNPVFRTVSGKVNVTVTYTGTIEELCRQTPEKLRGLVVIGKTTRAATAKDFGEDSGGMVNGETLNDYKAVVYTVRIKPGAPEGSYTISDRIPSALKIYDMNSSLTVGGKKADKYVYYNTEKQDLHVDFHYNGTYYEYNYTTDSRGKNVTVKTEIKGDAVLQITVLCRTVYDYATWDKEKTVIWHEGTGLAWLSDWQRAAAPA